MSKSFLNRLSSATLLTPAIVVAAAAAPPQVAPVDGPAWAAQLVAIDATGQVTFAADDQRRQLAAEDLFAWGSRVDVRGGSVVVLADGSLLVADMLGIEGDALRLAADLWGEPTLPLTCVRGLLLAPPTDALGRDRLIDRVAKLDATSDRLFLQSGDTVAGTLAGMDAQHANIVLPSGPIDIALDRITAVATNPTLTEPVDRTRVRWLVGLVDGSLLAAKSIVLDGDRLEVKLACGAALTSDPIEPAGEHMAMLRPLADRVVYLSDLPPTGFRHLPYLNQTRTFHADRNLLGGQLRTGGRVFSKGLGMPAASRLSWRFDDAYRRLRANVAIDDAAGRSGSVVFRVFTTTGDTWQLVFKSDVIRGGDSPTPIAVDLTGAKQLALVVDFADRADVLDYANWLNAALIK